MVSLAINLAAFLFLAYCSLIFVGVLIGIMQPKRPKCLNKITFSGHDPRACKLCLGGGHR